MCILFETLGYDAFINRFILTFHLHADITTGRYEQKIVCQEPGTAPRDGENERTEGPWKRK